MDLIHAYLEKRDWRFQENSNMDFSLQGLNHFVTSAVTAEFWLEHVYPPAVAQAHRQGRLHIHDAGILGPYCVGWDLEQFLRTGIAGVRGKAASRPPRHFRTALGQLVNLLFTLQGEAAGAQAVSSLDTLLAPFIRRDGLTYSAVRQALQEFVFNLNVPTRVGFQTPFTNVTLDVRCPPSYCDLPVTVGGVDGPETYGEFQPEMDMFNLALAEVFLGGDGNGRAFTFPIPTYNLTADFPWHTEVGRRIAEMTARYGTPYFANFIQGGLSPDDVRSMCCRLRLDTRELRRRGGGLFGAHPMTGSLGVVTINLPRIGYVADSREAFFALLDREMDLARDSLLVKRETVERLTQEGLYPYSRVYLQAVAQATGGYWSNHFNTIGVVGVHETCLNLLDTGIDSAQGQRFALDILEHMRARLVEYQGETEQMFNLEATPAEGVSYRLARLDREMYPGIRQSGDPAGDTYYTNSTHLPVGFTTDPFLALDHQEALQGLYTGGTVVHLFLGERVEDPQVVARLIESVAVRYAVPYFTLTPTFSVCPSHGYLAGEQWACARCGGPTEVWSRVVGYYRPVQCWNPGKRQEFADRVEYALPS